MRGRCRKAAAASLEANAPAIPFYHGRGGHATWSTSSGRHGADPAGCAAAPTGAACGGPHPRCFPPQAVRPNVIRLFTPNGSHFGARAGADYREWAETRQDRPGHTAARAAETAPVDTSACFDARTRTIGGGVRPQWPGPRTDRARALRLFCLRDLREPEPLAGMLNDSDPLACK